MKKTISFLVVIAMLFALVSCVEKVCQHRDINDDMVCDKCSEAYVDGIDVTTENSQTNNVIQATENTQATESAQTTESVQVTESVQTTESVQVTESIQTTENSQINDNLQTDMDNTETESVDNVLVCGVTPYAGFNEKDENGNWTIGFDTEFALEVGKIIGMEVKFQEIDWAQKYNELNSGAIDCIWNGFTANSSDDGIKRRDLVDFSYGYMRNQQCIVVRKDKLANFTSEESLKGKTACAERGSAGEFYANCLTDEFKVLSVYSQIHTFLEVKVASVDFAVVDIGLAENICGKGDYKDLTIVESIELDSEIYAVGFKKGSELTAKVNDAIKQLFDNGKIFEIAKKYCLENVVYFIENIDNVKSVY